MFFLIINDSQFQYVRIFASIKRIKTHNLFSFFNCK
jgi:hypothetical protein